MMQEAISKIVGCEDLSETEANGAMLEMIGGRASHSQIASFITAMRMKGESENELLGFAKAMRANASKIAVPGKTVDLCGTGGDGSGTFNISTVASFVVAAAGVTVAKHGNKSVSSKSGSADLLMALGIPHDLNPEQVQKCISEAGIGFLFAPIFHKSMANVAAPRREIGIRTFFNILGPLSSPADVKHQLIGVYDGGLSMKMAHVLRELGSVRALIVNSGGTDEITNIGLTNVVELSSGSIRDYEISPDMFGLRHAVKNDLRGGGPEKNARVALSILKGEKSPRADAVGMNAAAAIYAAEASNDIAEGLELAQRVMRNGEALAKLKEFAELSIQLESERQASLPIDAFQSRKMTKETLINRCGEISARLISQISRKKGGEERLAFLDESLFSDKSVLSAISLSRLLAIIDGTEIPPAEGARRSHERLSSTIEEGKGISIIGEYKPAYPSMTPLSPPPEPEEAMDAYGDGGLAGVSILVEPQFFSGSQKLFSQFRTGIDLPLLFKDFVVAGEQMEIASKLGADAVLLISKVLRQSYLEKLIGDSQRSGLEPLVEVHDKADIRKLEACGNYDSVRLVGINSRDLRSMNTDLESMKKLRPILPKDKIVIAESGIGSASDLKALKGFDAALIGSYFMRSDSVGKAVEEIVSAGRSVPK